ncbi:hypothetical protein [Propioniciclava tarda]|uniref:Uncharacterized protein n=1 Tax=Propioniciclava tarda TaxID=433330 RepID=A0A4Q9KNI2_PROTD|nr:hypothetical protein [Propioniciclava tarda]TBT96156.1 hypothetical protein ET996_00330 [Propioniciclava tarda]
MRATLLFLFGEFLSSDADASSWYGMTPTASGGVETDAGAGGTPPAPVESRSDQSCVTTVLVSPT